MEITPMDVGTFTALLTYVGAASGLAVAAKLGIEGAKWAPQLVGRFISLVARRSV